MPSRSPARSRFDDQADPLTTMGNLVDVMLVFACGLIAALLSQTTAVGASTQQARKQPIEQGRELSRAPDPATAGGAGLDAVGTVYRDPNTGKLIMVSE